ncbi:MAG: hypothetical protein ACNS62_03450 [Candidatus Cyclobacteriaceae bacterium M3_2C_046]
MNNKVSLMVIISAIFAGILGACLVNQPIVNGKKKFSQRFNSIKYSLQKYRDTKRGVVREIFDCFI